MKQHCLVILALVLGCEDEYKYGRWLEDMAKLAELKDRACACKDRACTEPLRRLASEWSQRNANIKVSDEDARKIAQLKQETEACVAKASGRK